MKHIVIIGNGISGITTARHIRKRTNYKITVISSETRHFYSRTALMYIYMGHMEYRHTKPYEDWFWAKNKIGLIEDHVEKVEAEEKKLLLRQGKPVYYDVLVLATGSKPNKFDWPGQDLEGVQGLYGMPDLKLMEKNTRDIQTAVVVGGGLIGVELVEMLLSRKIAVTMLVREKSFFSHVLPDQESAMINRQIRAHQADLRLGTELKNIIPDQSGRVRGVVTLNEEEIPCQFVGLAVGVSPNIDFLRDGPVETNRGVLVNEYFETNLPDVYAIGDCAEYKQPPPGRKKIEQVWYTGRIHGEILATTICGNRTAYQPGVWFNSAKFMDIEYQVYGQISVQASSDEAQFYWEHPSGQKSIRIAFNKHGHNVTGFNLMGIRFRHELCERWIRQKRPVQEVIKKLSQANFDPEFFQTFEKQVKQQFYREFPELAGTQTKEKKIFGLF
ncbi:MAG: NAD(P)/FAD-dependent oxidoreductase [Candidatus Cyclobacteriaceae bacterium M3_2C_046]